MPELFLGAFQLFVLLPAVIFSAVSIFVFFTLRQKASLQVNACDAGPLPASCQAYFDQQVRIVRELGFDHKGYFCAKTAGKSTAQVFTAVLYSPALSTLAEVVCGVGRVLRPSGFVSFTTVFSDGSTLVTHNSAYKSLFLYPARFVKQGVTITDAAALLDFHQRVVGRLQGQRHVQDCIVSDYAASSIRWHTTLLDFQVEKGLWRVDKDGGYRPTLRGSFFVVFRLLFSKRVMSLPIPAQKQITTPATGRLPLGIVCVGGFFSLAGFLMFLLVFTGLFHLGMSVVFRPDALVAIFFGAALMFIGPSLYKLRAWARTAVIVCCLLLMVPNVVAFFILALKGIFHLYPFVVMSVSILLPAIPVFYLSRATIRDQFKKRPVA
jgi:hypothetical protein